jgi:hypothetical protein
MGTGKLGTQVQWVNSQITDDKIYCTYIAPNEQMIREHAKLGGFPANSVSQVLQLSTQPLRNKLYSRQLAEQ